MYSSIKMYIKHKCWTSRGLVRMRDQMQNEGEGLLQFSDVMAFIVVASINENIRYV